MQISISMSRREVARGIQSRELSPVDLTKLMLERITRVDSELKSFATVMSEQALADADASLCEIEVGRYRRPLHGVPIGIKDLCYTKGVRTMGGTAHPRRFQTKTFGPS
jgi:amidase